MTIQTNNARIPSIPASTRRWPRRSRLLLAMVPVVLLLLALLPSRLIEARDLSTGNVLGCAESMTLRFTHSMFGGDVAETYVASSNGVERTRLVTERAAAAEYYAWTEEVVPIEGGYELRVAPHAFDTIVIRINEVGAHRLSVGEADRPLNLRTLVGVGGRVRLRSQEVTLIERLLGPC